MSLMRVLEDVLTQHVSAINARVVVERCRRLIGDPAHLGAEDRTRLLLTVRSTLRLFTDEARSAAITADVDRRLMLRTPPAEQERRVFDVADEEDLRAARAGARDLCLAVAASTISAQRVATAVSELARNIVSYTPGGQIEIEVRRGPPPRLRIVAHDRGKGIEQLEQVLAGQYRSKTGLGRGLYGVKRLMNQLRVQTGPQGTRIEAEVTLT